MSIRIFFDPSVLVTHPDFKARSNVSIGDPSSQWSWVNGQASFLGIQVCWDSRTHGKPCIELDGSIVQIEHSPILARLSGIGALQASGFLFWTFTDSWEGVLAGDEIRVLGKLNAHVHLSRSAGRVNVTIWASCPPNHFIHLYKDIRTADWKDYQMDEHLRLS